MSTRGPLYCFCRREEKGFMIECDGCDQWFHGACVGVTAIIGQRLSQWFCGFCSGWKKRHNELQLKVASLEKRLDDLQNMNSGNSVPNLQKEKEETVMLRSELEKAHEETRLLHDKCTLISKDKDELEKSLLEENVKFKSQLDKANERKKLLLVELEQARRRKKLSLSQH